jgi:hypothetical protein
MSVLKQNLAMGIITREEYVFHRPPFPSRPVPSLTRTHVRTRARTHTHTHTHTHTCMHSPCTHHALSHSHNRENLSHSLTTGFPLSPAPLFLCRYEHMVDVNKATLGSPSTLRKAQKRTPSLLKQVRFVYRKHTHTHSLTNTNRAPRGSAKRPRRSSSRV